MSTLYQRFRNLLTDEMVSRDELILSERPLRPELSSARSAAIELEYRAMERERIALQTDQTPVLPIPAAATDTADQSAIRYRPFNSGTGNDAVLVAALSDKLNGLAEHIRTQWEHYLVVEPHAQDQINADYRGRVSVYNDIVSVLHDLDNQDRLRVAELPEMLHPETLEHNASLAAQARLDEQEAIESHNRTWEQAADFRELITTNEAEIRGEWQADYEKGLLNRHDVDTYFAGQVDRHNAIIDRFILANSGLAEAPPPHVNYEQVRAEVKQEAAQNAQGPTVRVEQGAPQLETANYGIGMAIG